MDFIIVNNPSNKKENKTARASLAVVRNVIKSISFYSENIRQLHTFETPTTNDSVNLM